METSSNSKIAIRRVLLMLLALGLTAPHAAVAQGWPAKPVHLIVPFPAGGPTDQLSRNLGRWLAPALGQPVVIENVAGAMGSIGLTRVVRAPADGYTFGLGAHSTQAIAPYQMKLPYDPAKDFQPIGGAVGFAYTLIVHPSEPAKTIAELVARSKTIPGGMTFGSSGPGGGNHLLGELLRIETGANLLHVPYKGVAPAQTDVVGGHITFMFDVVASALPLIKGGKLRALGVTGKKRSPLLPDVPAISETVPGFDGGAWFAYFAPKGIPVEVTRRLHAEIEKIYRNPEFVSYLDKVGYEPMFGPPEQLGQTVINDLALWGRVMKAAGIKAE